MWDGDCFHLKALHGNLPSSAYIIWTEEPCGTPSNLRKKPPCTRPMSINVVSLARGAQISQPYDITGRTRASKSLSLRGMAVMSSSVHLANSKKLALVLQPSE